jgi:hypothetical protein
MMIDHPIIQQHNEYSTQISSEKKFISASELLASINMNIKVEPQEISDEELLQMALMFEKKYPQ